jgi:hypothetical protein
MMNGLRARIGNDAIQSSKKIGTAEEGGHGVAIAGLKGFIESLPNLFPCRPFLSRR